MKNKQIIKKTLHIIWIAAKTLLIIAAALALLCGGAVGFVKHYKPVDISEQYEYGSVAFEDVSKRVLTSGNIRPSDYAYVYIDSSEKVSGVHVKVGDVVAEGGLLLTYDMEKDRSDMERRLASARLNRDNAQLNLKSIGLPAEGNELMQYNADVTSARHNMDQAQSSIANLIKKIEQQQRKVDEAQKAVDRNDILLQAGNLPQVDYDTSVTALENARLAIDELNLSKQSAEDTLLTREAQLNEAGQRLSNALDRSGDEANLIKYRQQEIAIQLIDQQIEQIQSDLSVLSRESLSPVDGYVTAVNVREGEMAIRGSTLIEIAVASSIVAAAEVSEFDAPLLELGQEAEITTSGLPGALYTASITKIAASAVEKENSSTDEVIVPMELTLGNADERLKIGYSVDIAVYTDRRGHVLAVPIQSVLIEGGEKYMYVLDGGELTKTLVETGFYGDRSVEVKSGVALGDTYVALPAEVKPPSNSWFTTAEDWMYEKLSAAVDYASDRVPAFKGFMDEE